MTVRIGCGTFEYQKKDILSASHKTSAAKRICHYDTNDFLIRLTFREKQRLLNPTYLSVSMPYNCPSAVLAKKKSAPTEKQTYR
jgi:hypothetical protein